MNHLSPKIMSVPFFDFSSAQTDNTTAIFRRRKVESTCVVYSCPAPFEESTLFLFRNIELPQINVNSSTRVEIDNFERNKSEGLIDFSTSEDVDVPLLFNKQFKVKARLKFIKFEPVLDLD